MSASAMFCAQPTNGVQASNTVAMPVGRYLVVHAETGAVQELCEIARDTPPALLTLPSGDVLLSKDATSRFLGQFHPICRGHGPR